MTKRKDGGVNFKERYLSPRSGAVSKYVMILVLWVEVHPSKRYVKALIPEPMNVKVFGNGILADAFKMQMRRKSYQNMALIQCKWHPHKKSRVDVKKDTHRGKAT